MKGESQTLCWSCQRATNSPELGCPWSRINGTPVDGWTATKTIIRNPKKERRGTASYVVRECPLFLRDGKEQPACFYYKIKHQGEEYTIAQMAEREGVSVAVIRGRVKKGCYEALRVLRNP